MAADDLMFLLDDALIDTDNSINEDPWKVLIVDDDGEVHTITRLVLSDFEFAGRGLMFLSAYNSHEAIEQLREHPDTALVFLDVVMEEDDSGLKVVQAIRESLNNHFVRIILRTGQPGQAPERYVIDHYDINDYKEKTELTSNKLYTTTMASLRSYRDLMKIDNNRKGLERIIESSNTLGQFHSLNDFIEGVLMQLTGILEFSHNALYAGLPSLAACKLQTHFEVLSATGKYAPYLHRDVLSIEDDKAQAYIRQVITDKSNCYGDGYIALYFHTDTGSEHVLYMEGNHPLDLFDIELIELFITNVAVAYDNLYLRQESEETQREIIFGLGELTEARSKEVGKHVKRMAEYTRLLARLLKVPEPECEVMYIASTMHDMGKLAIPDAILNKPGKLTPAEFEVIKTHTTAGYEMLRKSTRPVMQMAATMALQHHERYDGTGYPQGLSGENIHIAGRITAVADVFDALGTDRVYKAAWPIDKILDYMRAGSGTHFDPVLIDLLFKNLDAFLDIRTQFSD